MSRVETGSNRLELTVTRQVDEITALSSALSPCCSRSVPRATYLEPLLPEKFKRGQASRNAVLKFLLS
ncbi:hypothetical protein RRG08_027753 [Elysia crispata]|uniref:Uncharacterized protein n=1 Tax=Elysia crispata TaxID=231223 RepID=A0AAE0Z967_9GAST|nr:hypothetical protein RRG08_027753 [Elysia crispata]